MKFSKPQLVFLLSLFVLVSCAEKPSDNLSQNDFVAQEIDFPEAITIPSADDLPIAANLYHLNDTAPVIVLCHQAGWNKVEYEKIGPTLHAFGFNCLAIDQRSGGHLLEWFNETTVAAEDAGKPTDYLDAEQDILAAVDFAAEKYKQPVILWGSSYSSTLTLYIAMENENVSAAVSFSPGNYFAEQKGDLSEKMRTFSKPMFVTSSKAEAPELEAMLASMEMKENQIRYVPDSAGAHGSRALWKTNPHNEQYWTAVKAFLEPLK